MAVTNAVDFSRYSPPGVYTEVSQGPQLAVNSSMPTAIGLFGTTMGFRTHVESVVVNDDTDEETPSLTQTLAHKGIIVNTIRVINPSSGAVYTVDADFAVNHLGGTINTDDATYALSRVIDGGHIEEGDTIQVSYQYTDDEYYNAFVFYDYDDVRAAYGDPFNTTKNSEGYGQIQSELTLAAKFAFLNGAYQVICVAVKPTDPDSPSTQDYLDALDKLANEPQVAIVVPARGQVPIFEIVRQHVETQSATRFERRALLGIDGTTSTVPTSTRIADAQSILSSRVALVSPDIFWYYAPELNKEIELGGQYMAASLAGMSMAMSWAEPLTHKRVTGWVRPKESTAEGHKNEESKNGLMVVEKTRRQIIRVRHGVTTDPTDLNSREWSVIGQQDALIFRIRDYLENANLIGRPIYPYTLINVKGSVEAALQSLIRDALLVDYQGLKVRQLLTNPDVIEVTFSWQPAYPLNYIVVRFGISLMTGESSVGTTANPANSGSARTVGAPTNPITNDFGGSTNSLRSF